MRHRKKTKSLGRKKGQRKQLMRNLAESLIIEEGIKTTQAKAKELQKFIEPLITKSKDGDKNAERYLFSKLGDKSEAVEKLVNDLGQRFEERPGGYTRIIKLSARDSDGAERALIEFVE